MRCYLCNADTIDKPMLSGVVVCLGCRRREGVHLDVTPPEMRGENEAFMRLFGEPHTVQLRHASSESDVVGEWKRLCDEILKRDLIAQKLVRGDLGPRIAVSGERIAEIVSGSVIGTDHQRGPLKLPADAKIRPGDHIYVECGEVKIMRSAENPKRIEFSFPLDPLVELHEPIEVGLDLSGLGCDELDCDADAHGEITLPRKDYEAFLAAIGNTMPTLSPEQLRREFDVTDPKDES